MAFRKELPSHASIALESWHVQAPRQTLVVQFQSRLEEQVGQEGAVHDTRWRDETQIPFPNLFCAHSDLEPQLHVRYALELRC